VYILPGANPSTVKHHFLHLQDSSWRGNNPVTCQSVSYQSMCLLSYIITHILLLIAAASCPLEPYMRCETGVRQIGINQMCIRLDLISVNTCLVPHDGGSPGSSCVLKCMTFRHTSQTGLTSIAELTSVYRSSAGYNHFKRVGVFIDSEGPCPLMTYKSRFLPSLFSYVLFHAFSFALRRIAR
jgi:hypothetical protein